MWRQLVQKQKEIAEYARLLKFLANEGVLKPTSYSWPQGQIVEAAVEYEDDDLGSPGPLPDEGDPIPPAITSMQHLLPSTRKVEVPPTPAFWHQGERPLPEIISHLRTVVLKQLSRLEGDRPRVAHRNELVTMATDELYAFLVHFLDVLFSLREYDTTGTREEQATRKQYAFGNWQTVLNAMKILELPTSMGLEIAKRMPAVQEEWDANTARIRTRRKRSISENGGSPVDVAKAPRRDDDEETI